MALNFRLGKVQARGVCYIIRKADKDRMKRESEKKKATKKKATDEEEILSGDEPP